jgi:GT2 family glycosyltransferase
VTTATPRVRVVVVNYNGGDLTLACLRAIAATEWPADALEVVLVDNGSHDGAAGAVAREVPTVRTIASDVNLGFAGGANLGLQDLPSDTSYVAVVNNDVTVPPGWLPPLVAALESDPACGAACPKILLASRYEAVQICGSPVRLGPVDRREVTVRVSGVRRGGDDVLRQARFADGFLGPEFVPGEPQPSQWASDAATLLLPAGDADAPGAVQMSSPAPGQVRLRTDAGEVAADVGPTPRWVELPPAGDAFDVINNVGSELQPDGYVRDRGYLEKDDGQYDERAEVRVWCGATVLLSATYLRAVGAFDPRLFAYYEDVDMSLRGAQSWRYVTVPQSVVRHVHMATSSTNTGRALYFNERNRLLVFARYRTKSAVVGAVGRFAAITMSYLRRDVLGRLVAGRRPSWTVSAARLRALRDCLLTWCGATPRRGWDLGA